MDLLDQTLESVVRQTKKPYEVIVIDNKSEEDLSGIEKICQKNNFSLIRNRENIGFVGNWNKCVQRSSGDYLCILHSDDILHRNWYESFEKIIRANSKVDVFSCALSLINQDNLATDVYFPLKSTGLLKNNFKEIWKNNYCALSVSGSLVTKKDVFKKIGLFKEEFGTECDAWFYYKLIKDFKIFYINEVLFGYKIHPFQTIDRELIEKTDRIKISKIKNNLGIAKLFFEEELGASPDYRFFYLKIALIRYLLAIKYLIKLDLNSYYSLKQAILQTFPDVFCRSTDYQELLKLAFHFVARILKGKHLARRHMGIFIINNNAL
jgi:glycosyltransferase involved in cell wall biosynthesis